MCSIMGFEKRSIAYEIAMEAFGRTISRGPDMSRVLEAGDGWLCFHRLAIMGLHEEGMQPFCLDGDMAVCNGELYGFRPIKEELSKKYTFVSDSDCEIILPLYKEYGLDMFKMLDAEFALILYDSKKDSFIAARDPIGIRPLFYGYLEDGSMVFASEAKNLTGICHGILPFPPGHYYAEGKFVKYCDLTTVDTFIEEIPDLDNFNMAEKMADYFGKYLVENYNLTDYRNDSEYASIWDKKEAAYDSMKQQQYDELNKYGELKSFGANAIQN